MVTVCRARTRSLDRRWFPQHRIVLAGFSSARRLERMTRGGACSDVFAQVADRGAGGVGLDGWLLPVQYELDDPDFFFSADVSESFLGEGRRGILHRFGYNCKRRRLCLGR